MAAFKLMTVAGKRAAINLDNVVFAQIDGHVIHLVSTGGFSTDITVDPPSDVNEVWRFLFPSDGEPLNL